MVRSDLYRRSSGGDAAITSCYDATGSTLMTSSLYRYQFNSYGTVITSTSQHFDLYGFSSMVDCVYYRNIFVSGTAQNIADLQSVAPSRGYRISNGSFPTSCIPWGGSSSFVRVSLLVYKAASIPSSYRMYSTPPSSPSNAGQAVETTETYVGVQRFDNEWCVGRSAKLAIKIDEYFGIAGIRGASTAVRGDLRMGLVGEGAATTCFDSYLVISMSSSASSRFMFTAAGQRIGSTNQGYSTYGFASLADCNAKRNIFTSGSVDAVIAFLTTGPSISSGNYPTSCYKWGPYYFVAAGLHMRRAEIPSDYSVWSTNTPVPPIQRAWSWGWGQGWGYVIQSWLPSLNWGWGQGWGWTWGQHR